MKIYTGLELDVKGGEVVSIIGAGGKTTTLFLLAEELKRLNKKVLITTTTAIYNPEEGQYDYYFLEDIKDEFNPDKGSITVYGEEIKSGKLIGSSLLKMDEIIERKLFDFVLIEADGSKGKPIKAPANHEPVVSKCTTKTIGIIGLDCLGKRIEDIVHRPEILIEIVGKDFQDIVDEDTIIKLILNNKGLFKESQGEKLLLLNKAHDKEYIIRGKKIKRFLLEKGFKGKVIVGDIKERRFY